MVQVLLTESEDVSDLINRLSTFDPNREEGLDDTEDTEYYLSGYNDALNALVGRMVVEIVRKSK